MTLHKITRILQYLIMVVSVVLVGMFYFGGFVKGTQGTPAEEPVITETILTWAYILFGIAALVSVVFPLIYIIIHPKNATKSLILLGIAAILIFVAYQLASGQVMNITGYKGPDNVPSTLKNVGTGLIFMYILAGLAILSILYTEIAKIFK